MAINMLRLFLIVTVVVGSNFPASSNAASPDLSIETFVRGLNTPWALDFASDGRIFISERPGRIRIVEQGQLRPEPWMMLEVAAVGEAGLLGLAVDPQFSQNRFLYVAYSYRVGAFSLRNRLVRLREDVKGKGVLDKVLIDDVAGASNHDGGRVKFGPDGKLYWTVGDAQTTRYAQNVKSWNGKILRLNSDGTIAADNPFPNSYVYSLGHRNPQGLAWQPGTGRLYATEHGPSGFQGCCRDEVNYIEPGKNYGWPEIRGDDAREGMIHRSSNPARTKLGRQPGLFLLASDLGPGRCFLPACVGKLCIASFSIPTIRARWKISSVIFRVSWGACEILSKDPIKRSICLPATAMAAAPRRPTTIGSFA